jgi:hypothetical protein
MQFMLKQYFSKQTKTFQYLCAGLVVLIVASIGTYLLIGTHAVTPYASTTGDSGALVNGATKKTCAGSSDGNCVVFGATSSSSGTTYYVSPNGSDSNNGTSQGSAWATIGHVNSVSLKLGDTVLFQGGATFNDTTLTGSTSGITGKPITYGSYGSGNANLPQGIWINSGLSFLTFQNFTVRGPGLNNGKDGIGSDQASDIIIQNDWVGNVLGGIAVVHGDRWSILNNTVDGTGDSCILTQMGDNGGSPGNNWVIDHNTIENCAQVNLGYGEHGIYLKSKDSQVENNTITNFGNNGVSPRYGGDTIAYNNISNGGIGIAYFSYDWIPKTTYWHDNTISNVSTGMYAPIGGPGQTNPDGTDVENFVIQNNNMTNGVSEHMNLQTTGTLTLTNNPPCPDYSSSNGNRYHCI